MALPAGHTPERRLPSHEPSLCPEVRMLPRPLRAAIILLLIVPYAGLQVVVLAIIPKPSMSLPMFL